MKLDLGCGQNKIASDYIGVDIRKFPGVQVVCDIKDGLPFKSNSIEVIFSTDVIEHLEYPIMWKFFDEIKRILTKDGEATVIFPVCNSYFGFYGGHVIYLSYQWFTNDLPIFSEMFDFKVENIPSARWPEVEKLIPGITFDLAKDIFFNLIHKTKLILKKK